MSPLPPRVCPLGSVRPPAVLLTALALIAVLRLGAAGQQPAAPVPCTKSPEFLQLAFWLGDWEVFDQGKRIAESRISVLDGSCAILEAYSQPDGFSGRSINFFDPVLKQWRQTWVDVFGNVSEFAGPVVDGELRLEGRSHRSDGRTILRKMTVGPAPDGEVRQHSQRSNDGGATWELAYDYRYRRKRPSP